MLSIISPTYNEKENIEPLLLKISDVLKKKAKFEILIADSNSKDGTIDEVRRVAKKYKIRARAINAGDADLSNAVLISFKETRGDVICVMDADLQHPPEAIPIMLEKIRGGADFVNTSRFMPGAKLEFGNRRDIISKGFQFLTRIFVPKTRRLTDTASGFFMFKKKVIGNVKMNPLGYKIMLEVLARGKIDKIEEVPINFKKRERGKSKLNTKQIFLAFRHLIRLSKLEYRKILKFIVVGLSGVIVSEGFLWILTESGLHYLISGAISIEAAIISNFILNDVWTFKDDRKGKFLSRFFRFNVARILAAFINLIALWFFTAMGAHYLISNLIGIVIATIFTYITSIMWVWK